MDYISQQSKKCHLISQLRVSIEYHIISAQHYTKKPLRRCEQEKKPQYWEMSLNESSDYDYEYAQLLLCPWKNKKIKKIFFRKLFLRADIHLQVHLLTLVLWFLFRLNCIYYIIQEYFSTIVTHNISSDYFIHLRIHAKLLDHIWGCNCVSGT